MSVSRLALNGFFLAMLIPPVVAAQDFKQWEAKVVEYKRWLDSAKADGNVFWSRLDSSRRPHRLYVGEGFHGADYQAKEQFVEIFSHYLAGHPEKFMLIDLFDAATGEPVGEFGWGGFKLYPSFVALEAPAQDKELLPPVSP